MNQNKILDLYNQATKFDDKTVNGANRLFIDLMKMEGCILIGFGMYSTVWMHGDRFFKVNSRYQGVYDGFFMWMLECIKHPDNNHLPRFGDCVVRGDRYCVEVEPLNKCTSYISDYELMQYANANPGFMDALNLAFDVFERTNRANRRGYLTMVERLNLLDIKPENLMYRGDTVVLNDPISYWARPDWKAVA